ncbi:MFS transporter [Paraburkholderia heleia]|uniref:MFS transporter n=1 Tax=Paraburkholderia heleia TaxID=634127 RepID=UPI000A00A994|nr:MFS transporter [Paraburkholderia heleia]
MEPHADAPVELPDALGRLAARADDRPETIRKVGRRMTWLMFALNFVAVLDRGNLGFAALQMNKDLGLTSATFGIGVGVFFFAYSLLEVPSNMMMARYGARLTIARIAIAWGLVQMLMAFETGPTSFYVLRALLGAAEAGLAPGMLLYISYWFPYSYRARYNAVFAYAIPTSYAVASIVSGSILQMNGLYGLAGWKWLFLLEGFPAIALGIITLLYLTDRPAQAHWLTPEERSWLQTTIDREALLAGSSPHARLRDVVRHPTVLLLAAVNTGIYGGLATLGAWLPQIVRSFGLPLHWIGPVAAIPPLVAVVGMFFIARHSDRTRERVYHTFFLLLVAALGYVVVTISAGPAATIVGFVIANVAVYSVNTIFWTMPQSYLPKEITATGIAFVNAMGSMTGFVVIAMIGRVQGWMGSLTAGFPIVCGVFVIASIAVLTLAARLKRGKSAIVAS